MSSNIRDRTLQELVVSHDDLAVCPTFNVPRPAYCRAEPLLFIPVRQNDMHSVVVMLL